MKYELFSRNIRRTIFLHYNLDFTGSLWYQFGSLWTTPWPDEKDLFLKFVIREIRNFPYEKLTFFLGNLYQKYFSLYTLTALWILHNEFGLIWTTPWPDQKDLFLKFVIREIRKFPYENLNFCLDKLYKKFFSFYTLTALWILHTEFGLIWTTPWPNEKDLFLKFVIREFRKFP